MSKWNEEGAPNLNLSSADVKASKLVSKHKKGNEFSEELADGEERNTMIRGQQTNKRK